MIKPIIGVLPDIDVVSHGNHSLFREYVNSNYINAVIKAGGNPVILPIIKDDDMLMRLIEGIDGLLITGGADINPLVYGEEPIPEQGVFYSERDNNDIRAIKIAYKMGIPIFGICRGVQILNVAFGGTLYQEVKLAGDNILKHSNQTSWEVPVHSVKIYESTKLFEILGGEVLVNSYHHQAVKKAAQGFKVSAIAKDGIIEGIEMQSDNFVAGVQWHPEFMVDSSQKMLDLFKYFLKYAKTRK